MNWDPVVLLLGISIGGLLTSVQEQRAGVAAHIIKPHLESAAYDQSQLIGFLPNLVKTEVPASDTLPPLPLLPVPDYSSQTWEQF